MTDVILQVASRDVTKFEFNDVRTSNVFTRFDECFDECRMRICGKIFVLRLITYVQTARERRQTSFVSQIQPITSQRTVTYE